MYDPGLLYFDPISPNFSVGFKKLKSTKEMPWVAKKSDQCPADKPWGVFNQQTGRKVACHATRDSALAQMRALYANVPESRRKSMGEELISYLSPLRQFAEEDWLEDNQRWVQIYPFDTWDHPVFGETTIDADIATKMKNGFDQNIRGQKILVDYDHGLDKAKGGKAAGEFIELDVREDGLYGLAKFNDIARQEIDDGEWNYLSGSHYDSWTHPQHKIKYEYVFDGAGLTNSPWVKGMAPLNFSEIAKQFKDSKKPYGDVTYADPGYQSDGVKRYPLDNETHIRAAWSYINMPKNAAKYSSSQVSAIKGKIRAAMKRIGADISDEKENKKAASETDTEGGNMELESELRKVFGLSEDADVLAEAKKVFAELEPLRKAHEEHDKKLAFAEEYPEEAKRLARLEERDRENGAKRFAETFSRFKVTEKDDDKEIEIQKGYSQLAVDKIEEFAKNFSERTASLDELGEILTMLPNSIVEFGERGSSRTKDFKGSNENDARKDFAEIVSEIAAKDKKSWNEALSIAAQTHPDEFEAYRDAANKAAVTP